MNRISFFIYHLFAKNLPASYNNFGKLSKKIRFLLGKRIVKSCGHNVNFEKGANFGSDLIIGNNSGIGINAQISRGVTIGNDVMMAPEVVIITTAHEYKETNIPMIDQGSQKLKKVIIKNDVWIGQRVIILPGVVIENGTIIGANSVVTKSFPSYSIIGGNPARIIKRRV
jgi:maltose O-acetyltransferase